MEQTFTCALPCCAKSLQLCLTLCNSLDCSPPGFSVYGILQARILEQMPFPPSGDLPDSRIKTAFPAAPALQVDSLPLSHQEVQDDIFTFL